MQRTGWTGCEANPNATFHLLNLNTPLRYMLSGQVCEFIPDFLKKKCQVKFTKPEESKYNLIIDFFTEPDQLNHSTHPDQRTPCSFRIRFSHFTINKIIK